VGGIGSGRYRRFGAKAAADDCLALDVRRCARAGGLKPGFSGTCTWSPDGDAGESVRMQTEHDRVILSCRHRGGGDEWQGEGYPVTIARTPCHFGSSRPWFICPALGCGRRVAILYSGAIFACRHCYRLAYISSREGPSQRAARRADKVRARLGWQPGILNGEGDKPKWMRWLTFEKLVALHDELVHRSLLGMMRRSPQKPKSLGITE
jgi:hypothetical protein